MVVEHTLAELEQMQRNSLARLVAAAGNPTHLARMIGVPVSTVHGWVVRGRISKRGVEKVEACPKLPFDAKTLRPDL